MEITVNGESRVAPDEPINVIELLKIFEVEMPDMVSVQLNGGFVKREKFDSTVIKAKDAVDFLYFLGGGC